MLPLGISPTDLFAGAAGFFAVMWLVSLRKHGPKQRKWYRTEMPSTYIIETEA